MVGAFLIEFFACPGRRSDAMALRFWRDDEVVFERRSADRWVEMTEPRA
jgi:hypothetical protein